MDVYLICRRTLIWTVASNIQVVERSRCEDSPKAMEVIVLSILVDNWAKVCCKAVLSIFVIEVSLISERLDLCTRVSRLSS